MNWMEETYGSRRSLLSGLCGGAITGLLAGDRDARVAGLLGLAITAVLASRAADASRHMTIGQLETHRKCTRSGSSGHSLVSPGRLQDRQHPDSANAGA